MQNKNNFVIESTISIDRIWFKNFQKVGKEYQRKLKALNIKTFAFFLKIASEWYNSKIFSFDILINSNH
jgi:hypothetical protein